MSYNSGLELPKVAFSEITYSLIPLGSFFVGFDLDNAGILSKIDNTGTITVIEGGGPSLYDYGTGSCSTVRTDGTNTSTRCFSSVLSGSNNNATASYTTLS